MASDPGEREVFMPSTFAQETLPSVKEILPLRRRPEFLRLVLVALLAEIGYAVLNISTMPVYLRSDRNFDTGVIGIVLVAYLLSEAVFKSPMGQLADRIGSRKLMATGPAISVCTSLASFIVPHRDGSFTEVFCFVGLRALDGIGAAMLWPAAFARVGESVDDGQRQEAMSFLNLCYMVGIALALPLGGAIDDFTGTHSAGLFLAAGLFAVVSVTAYFFLKETPKGAQVIPEEASWKTLLENFKQIPTYIILAVVTFAGIGFPMAIVKLFAQDQFNMSEFAFGALVFPAAILMAVLSVPVSKLGEKFGRARSVHVGIGLCALGMCMLSSGMFFPFLRLPSLLAVSLIPIGFGFLLAIPAWMASVSDLNPECRGANLGAVMTAQGLGAILTLPVGAYMYHALLPIGFQLHLGPGFAHYSPFFGSALCVTAAWLISLRILRNDKPMQMRV